MGNCHPEKTNVDRGEAEVDIGFRGLTISHVTLEQSRSGEYLCLYLVLRLFNL